MAGDSGTPLIKKLGIKEGMKISIIGAEKDFWDNIDEMPEVDLKEKPVKGMDFILYFTDSKKEYEKNFPKLSKMLVSNGMLWIGWPKKASKTSTDMTEHIVRDFGLACGLVDIKGCAITEKWSGLKFVIRLKDRG